MYPKHDVERKKVLNRQAIYTKTGRYQLEKKYLDKISKQKSSYKPALILNEMFKMTMGHF